MPVDPSSLRPRPASMTVTTEQACDKCGYQLKGLQVADPCPECGTTIPVRRLTANGDNLTDAPAAFLRRYALATTLTAAAGPLALAATTSAWLFASALMSGVAFVATLAFTAAVWFMSLPRPRSNNTIHDATIDAPAWRYAATAAPAAWLALAGFAMVRAIALANAWAIADEAATIVWLAFLVATAALTPLLIHLASVADWAGDTGLAARLRGSAWIIGFTVPAALAAGIIPAITTGPFADVTRIAAIAVYGCMAIALLIICIGLIQHAGVAIAAVRTNAAQHARDQRIAEKRAAGMAQTVDRQFAVPEHTGYPDQQEDHPDTQPRPRIGQGQRIEPSDATESYELEPEDTP